MAAFDEALDHAPLALPDLPRASRNFAARSSITVLMGWIVPLRHSPLTLLTLAANSENAGPAPA